MIKKIAVGFFIFWLCNMFIVELAWMDELEHKVSVWNSFRFWTLYRQNCCYGNFCQIIRLVGSDRVRRAGSEVSLGVFIVRESRVQTFRSYLAPARGQVGCLPPSHNCLGIIGLGGGEAGILRGSTCRFNTSFSSPIPWKYTQCIRKYSNNNVN
jgi:hypothetical protein